MLLSLATAEKPKAEATMPNSIILENYGIMLKPQGYITFSTNNMLSLFRKVKLPNMSQLLNCKNDVPQKFNNEIRKTTLEYVKLFDNIARPMPKSNETRSNRNKRGILAFGIGLGIVDLVLGGISYGTLKHHIDKLDSKFSDFITKQHQFDENVIEWDDQLISMIGKSQEDIDAKFQMVQCQILETTGDLLAMQYVDRWVNTLDNLFKPLTEGRLRSQLTP